MLDIDDAILATTVVTPAKIATGESQAGPFTQTLTVSNFGTRASNLYSISPASALNWTEYLLYHSFMTGFATVAFSAPTVTVPAGGSATVNVTITANAGLPDRSQYGGYVKFTPVGGGQAYTVPYGGFKGDYQSIQVLTGGFPCLAKLGQVAL